MIDLTLETSFGEALFSLAKEEGKVEAYRQALASVETSLSTHSELREFLSSRAIPCEKINALIDEIYADPSVPKLSSFLKLVADYHLFSRFERIEFAFDLLADQSIGVERGIVYSTRLLGSDELASIEKSLGDRVGKRVILQNQVDKSLLGGIKVVLGDKIFDGSLKMRLSTLEETLIKGENL